MRRDGPMFPAGPPDDEGRAAAGSPRGGGGAATPRGRFTAGRHGWRTRR